jgi:predicted DNA-binding transcriptional regulator YafY
MRYSVEAQKQSIRIIKILEYFSMGKRLTIKDIHNIFEEIVSTRTIHRDIETIEEAGIPLEYEKNDNSEYVWFFPAHYRKMVLPVVQGSELISLYILKSYLKLFSDTFIDKELHSLQNKIEALAPGDLFMEFESLSEQENSIFWDQSFGDYDYSKSDAVLSDITNIMVKKQWAAVTYKSLSDGKTRQYDIYLHRLFAFNGVLYIAVYFPKYGDFLALAVQQIQEVKIAQRQDYRTPEFNIAAFKHNRFGVFSGSVEKVEIEVRSGYAKWFINRSWHPSQQIIKNKDGSLLLTMDVPLSRDFITWILGWHDGIKVIKPQSLIKMVKEKLQKSLELYG